ncbi:hypothetical protein RUND412_002580 [Rhizina undulata]
MPQLSILPLFYLTLLSIFSVAFSAPAPEPLGFDMERISNQIRNGAVAVATPNRPHASRYSSVGSQNGVQRDQEPADESFYDEEEGMGYGGQKLRTRSLYGELLGMESVVGDKIERSAGAVRRDGDDERTVWSERRVSS